MNLLRRTEARLSFASAFLGRNVLVTGHTGFKGSWLALWLHELGAILAGVALPTQESPNHWELLGLDVRDYRLDIRDPQALTTAIDDARPEIVFHLAAQSVVRRGY